jgi:hypothetical protein
MLGKVTCWATDFTMKSRSPLTEMICRCYLRNIERTARLITGAGSGASRTAVIISAAQSNHNSEISTTKRS